MGEYHSFKPIAEVLKYLLSYSNGFATALILKYHFELFLSQRKTKVSSPLPPEFEAQVPGAFVLIFRKSPDNMEQIEVLLVHRNDLDIWNLPGGGYDPDEEGVVEAAVRETIEETGLKVNILDESLTEVFAQPVDETSPYSGERRYDYFHVCVGVMVGGELQLTDESKKIQWFPIDRLPNNLYFKHKMAIGIIGQKFWSGSDLEELVKLSINKHTFVPSGI